MKRGAVDVTFPALKREGIEKTMWVSPSDRFGQNSFEHGGFVYSFADNSPPVLLPIGTRATPLD